MTAWRMAGRAMMHAHPDWCENPLLLVNVATGESMVKRCGAADSSKCTPCGYTYRNRVRDIAWEGGSKLAPGGSLAVVTLTAPGDGLHFMPNGEPCPC